MAPVADDEEEVALERYLLKMQRRECGCGAHIRLSTSPWNMNQALLEGVLHHDADLDRSVTLQLDNRTHDIA